MTLEPPPGSRPAPPEPGKGHTYSFRRLWEAIGLALAVFGALFPVGLTLLPLHSRGEKAWWFSISIAISTAVLTGLWARGARASARWLGATVGFVGTAFLLCGGLIIAVAPVGREDLALRGNPTSDPTPTDAPGDASRGEPTTPSTSSPPSEPAQPTPNPTPSSAQPDDGEALYLADVNGVDWPSGSWTLGGTRYPHSLGVSLGCEAWDEASFTLGHPYSEFVATVRIDDPVPDLEHDVDLNVVVYDDRNGDGGIQLSQERVKLFDLRPGSQADVDIRFDEPVSNLILGVGLVDGVCLHSDVVWGDARVLP